MDNLPKSISSGHVSRLFPSLGENSREMRATSTLLSMIRAVPELLDALISSIGIRINDRTTLQAYTEVIPLKNPDLKIRPDGLLYVKNQKTWSCFVETKVGKAKLDQDQIKKYVRAARQNGVDAVLTISNEFTVRLDQSPVELGPKQLGKINLLHLSWRQILATAQGLLTKQEILDREKRFLLEEFVRFLRDQAVGDTAFASMPQAWTELNERIASGVKISFKDSQIKEVASALQQQYSEMAIILTEHLGVQCKLRLSRNEEADKTKWSERIQKNIAKNGLSKASFSVPGAIANIDTEIDFKRSTISYSVETDQIAPRKTSYGKASWLAGQLGAEQLERLFLSVRWNTRAKNLEVRAHELSPEKFKELDHSSDVKSLALRSVESKQNQFNSRKNFIVQLETELISFYDNVVQNLKPHIVKAPAPKKPLAEADIRADRNDTSIIVPDFLKRI